MPHHTRYLVSKQSNRNLALDTQAHEQMWFTELVDADTFAAKEARRTKDPRYVHEVTVRPVRSHVPVVELRSSDL